jgi:hypothetical protein
LKRKSSVGNQSVLLAVILEEVVDDVHTTITIGTYQRTTAQLPLEGDLLI